MFRYNGFICDMIKESSVLDIFHFNISMSLFLVVIENLFFLKRFDYISVDALLYSVFVDEI